MTNSKRILFHAVQVYEFPLVLGDNPSCSEGPAVELAWHPSQETTWDIDCFEALRRQQRRSVYDLLLTKSERVDLLLQHGAFPVRIRHSRSSNQSSHSNKRNSRRKQGHRRNSNHLKKDEHLQADHTSLPSLDEMLHTIDAIERKTDELSRKLNTLCTPAA